MWAQQHRQEYWQEPHELDNFFGECAGGLPSAAPCVQLYRSLPGLHPGLFKTLYWGRSGVAKALGAFKGRIPPVYGPGYPMVAMPRRVERGGTLAAVGRAFQRRAEVATGRLRAGLQVGNLRQFRACAGTSAAARLRRRGATSDLSAAVVHLACSCARIRATTHRASPRTHTLNPQPVAPIPSPSLVS